MAISKWPVRKGQTIPLSGLGINTGGNGGGGIKAPIADLQAMSVKWVRMDLSGAMPTSNRIDALINWYNPLSARPYSWLIDVTPVAGGAFANNVNKIIAVANRYAALGIKYPVIAELGNEAIQQNVASFADENTCDDAYQTLLAAVKTSLAPYNVIVAGINDEAPFVLKYVRRGVAQGVTVWPDAFSMHGYSVSTGGSPGTNGPGTFDMLKEISNSDIWGGEGNYTANTVSSADAITYFSTMVGAMGTRPWCYYTTLDVNWNSATLGYSWYSTQSSADADGNFTASARTATLTGQATAIGATLP